MWEAVLLNNKKLNLWAQQLLDTGKRNNMINFKDTKISTIEIVYPSAEVFYDNCINSTTFEIYAPKINDDKNNNNVISPVNSFAVDKLEKSEYIEFYSSRIRKNNQVLVYANTSEPMKAINNIGKKAKDFLEETGVNVNYVAFGFVHWRETEKSNLINRAPLILMPITLRNESSVSPYFIEITGDDIVINPTFNYRLESQHGIKLPEYKDDESLSSYIVRVKEVVSKLHWEVTSECKIGIFSFLKINMYHDLMDNEEKILQNKNVRLLLGEKINTHDFVIDENIGNVENEIIDLHTVVDADSSQIQAIQMAKSGKSFVLQGPPGTGKSQTITNIIAECLHDGKKILFVSEKLAALNIVHDKLKQVGLDEFCLELHSYKSNKKKVIDELCKTLRTDKSITSAQDYAEIQINAKLQKQLDFYAKELHKPIAVINKSMYQLYNMYSSYRQIPDLELTLKNIETKDETYFNEANDLLDQYAEYVSIIGQDYKKNEWYGYKNQQEPHEAKNELRSYLSTIINGLSDFIKKVNKCKAEYAVNIESLLDVEKYINLFKLLANISFLKPVALLKDNTKKLINVVEKMEQLSEQIILIRKNLDNKFETGIYEIDGQDYYNKMTNLYSGFFSRLFSSEYKNMIGRVKFVSKTGEKPKYQTAQQSMKFLKEYQSLIKQFEEEKKSIKDLVNDDYINFDTNWNDLKQELEAINNISANELNYGNILNMSDEIFTQAKNKFSNYANIMTDSINIFRESLNNLQNDFDFVVFNNMPLTDLFSKMQQYMESIDKVEDWLRFRKLLKQIEAKDLMAYIDCIIKNEIHQNQIVAVYKKLFYKQWINYVIHENPVFANFTRVAQDKIVKQFAQKDKLQFEINKAQIKAELSSKRPPIDFMEAGSVVSILLREGQKKRKQKSIRNLFKETGEVVQIIKPCFLMSPLSVSTFLNGNNIQFDTVIFDEASQMFPQDAICAIYRGKQLIVVGDSNQMPPSNFFNSSVEFDYNDEETEDITDFESILDLCSTTLPQVRLKWHYRSRYEQLIRFSNKNFYDNSLITFPSSTIEHEDVGVDYYHVDGIFDRDSHTNQKEAELIVDMIYKHIEKYPDRSLGVVAFSVAQQNLIDEVLSWRRLENYSKEWFFEYKDTNREPFFIKNLETVHGDERDTIIFSVAYGFDKQGRFLYNFGPLNRVGGERRLNVAVTRAKHNIKLVASIHSTDIDLKRTSAEGVRLLREYLDYAENGSVALERNLSVNPFDDFDSEFEMEVCDFLREHGFIVDAQVGCSGFRIDLGLRKPNSSEYVLAIECDGATYHSSKNARDRDRLRQEILEGMGWKFYRIWSTEWFKNTVIEKRKLLDVAKQAICSKSDLKNNR